MDLVIYSIILLLVIRHSNSESNQKKGGDCKMGFQVDSEPPENGSPYIIGQLEGERISIPGSKGVFRILASAKQTCNKIAVFTSGAVLSDAPGFHYHNQAQDVFLVIKGYLKLWNGDKCRIMGPGDFAYIPPVSLGRRH
jgi:hypothetical protein